MIRVILCAAVYLLVSCTREEFIKYSEVENRANDPENGLVQETQIEAVSYAVKFIPPQQLAFADHVAGDNIHSLDSLSNEYAQLTHFKMRYKLSENQNILQYKSDGLNGYTDRGNYFAFGLQHDIRLVHGSDTLEPVLFNFSNSYGLSGEAQFVYAFPLPQDKIKSDVVVVLNDQELGGGKLQFRFKKKDLQSFPKATL